MQHNFSASLTANTTIGSTRGFFSFSTQSVLESQKGPSFIERLKSNILHLSANIHRYTGINDLYHNFAAVFRLIQYFCIYLIPQCKDFWNMNSTTSFFTYLLEIPLHLCFVPMNDEYHAFLLIILFLFFTISVIFIAIIILRNPDEYSISNSVIFYISFYCNVLTPILSFFVFTLFGYCLNSAVFQHKNNSLIITACVLGSITVVFVLISHYFSFYIMRGTSTVNFSLLLVPWSPYISIYAHYETFYLVLSFLEEFLDIENKYHQIGFTIFAFIAANPIVIFYLFYNPIFQDLNDIVYLATIVTVNMISAIFMDLRFVTDKLTPVIIFVVSIISFVLFLILYSFIMRRIINKYSTKMFTKYRHTKPCLPPTTPLIFTEPMPTQSLLSHEAYSVMQSFSSLGISRVREYHYYMFVGAYNKSPAVKNIDFIKWGLNYFHDTDTLIICAQICQYFNDYSQTQAVLIQRLNETDDISYFLTPIIYNLILYHADVISDKPAYLKKLQKKAYGGLVRCRRALGIFWGSVLKHSSSSMNESLCKLRDTIYETRNHFDEMIRCYPISLDAIGLYLNFMTEICGEYIKCNQYINQMSSKFIEMKSDAIENDESINGISVLLNDPNRSFSPYISKLTQYLDQESRTHKNTKGPIISIWLLGIISAIALIVCILVIMVRTLVSFNEYPKILSIVNSADDVFIEMASLIIGVRRICLFASGFLEDKIYEHQHGMKTSVYEDPQSLIEWLIQRGEDLPKLILRFYKNMTSDIEILNIVTGTKRKFKIYGTEVVGSLDFIMDMMSMAVRNVAVNIPSYFSELTITNSATLLALENMKNEKNQRQMFGNLGRSKHLISNSIYGRENMSYSVGRQKSAKDDSFVLETESISAYSGICNSSEMRLLLENIEAAAQICDDFIDKYQKVSERKVNSLSKLLYYSMIFFPICYVILFGLILLILCLYLFKESNFRLTLFLSLPETVAFEIYNGGGQMSNSKNPLVRNDSIVNQVPSIINLQNSEQLVEKEKALRVESLYQFSMRTNFITGTGIKEYVISCVIFIIIAALSMFGLTFYSRSINETFQSRSYMLCSSALRYSSVSYASMFIGECFLSSTCLSIFNDSEIIRLADKFIERARVFNNALTYGDKNIKFDFHEYESIEKLLLNDVKMEIPEQFIVEHSHTLLQHSGYKDDTVNTFMSLFVESSKGIIQTFKQDPTYYRLNGSSWQSYNHLIITHLRSDLELATYYYITGVSQVIDKSFTIALIMSIISIVILIIILIGPIMSSSIAISRYLTTMLHVLCQVPPEVFNRSFYISKWLRGQISMSNYRQYETTFKRTVSNDIQKKILQDTEEKIIVFSSSGEYINTPCFDVSSIKEKTLANVLSHIISHIDQNAIDEVQRTFDRFQESKEMIERVEILVKDSKNRSINLAFTGIASSDLSSSILSLQRYYSYIVILVSDVTEKEKIKETYLQEKEKTIHLYKQVVPDQLAPRMHNGEFNISFSATIGSVLSIMITNYDELLNSADLSVTSQAIFRIREIVYKTVDNFSNISLISITGNQLLFSAGLFNDEQNGRTETIDTLEFASSLFIAFQEVVETCRLNLSFKFGVATGGPIFCKSIGEYEITTVISGETVKIAKILRDLCEDGQLLLERTTFECSEGLGISLKEAGQYEYQGKKNLYYSIVLDKNNQIVLNN